MAKPCDFFYYYFCNSIIDMLTIDSISFAYDKNTVIQNVSFSVKQGEHLSLIGESGSGKSTLLKLLYGEYDLKEGSIFWKKKQILGPKYNLITGPDFMKYVAQEFDLMPFTTVETNIGEFLSNLYPQKKQQRVEELIKVVGLEEVANTKVKYLSGGQKQRVALARALAKEPKIILLDEPFSHIDNFKKHSLRRNLFSYLKSKKITCITATHDKEDVLGYADNMLVLEHGKKLILGSPRELYNNPKHKLIASFFGEFNEFKLSELSDSFSGDTILIYANELKPNKIKGIEVSVQRSFFQGDYFLIEALFNDRNIFFRGKNELKENQKILLSVSKNIIKKRSNQVR